jgi:pimeloyl-ACP methyl ester carboxylesterase
MSMPMRAMEGGIMPGMDDYGSAGRSAWLDIDWREHCRHVEIEGRSAAVVELGPRDAPPVVFVHGLSGRWTNWLENIPDLARDHRVVAMDLPGFGESDMPAEKITISGYGRWLDRLCEALDIDAACFVGNSMGGFISAEAAIKFPERVERLVLVSAAGITAEHLRNEPLLAIMRSTEAMVAWQTAWVIRRSQQLSRRPRLKKALLWLVATHPERLSSPMVHELVQGAGKPGFVDAIDAITSYPIRDRLPDIRCPTLIVWGDSDRVVPTRDAYVFDRLVPDSRLRLYEDTGHVPMVERPARFNHDLRLFLAEQAPDASERRADAEAQQAPEPAGVEAEDLG